MTHPHASDQTIASGEAPPVTALAALKQSPSWELANASEREVLLRIAAQRDRLGSRQQAQLQAKALRAQRTSVPAEAPFTERLAVFARLHPIALAGIAALAVMLGPKKLMRTGMTLLPLIAKLKR